MSVDPVLDLGISTNLHYLPEFQVPLPIFTAAHFHHRRISRETMARPSKRAIAFRHARASKRRIASKSDSAPSFLPVPVPVEDPEVSGAPSPLQVEDQEASGAPSPLPAKASDLNFDLELEHDAQSEGLLSEEEDEYPVRIGRLATGWEKAEIGLFGYSSARVHRQDFLSQGQRRDHEKAKSEADLECWYTCYREAQANMVRYFADVCSSPEAYH